jgi:hypothetical protein|tara:strand:- start:1265 stop:1564 length:300 start_codon:yes stop_codon:yes gene_type:complete
MYSNNNYMTMQDLQGIAPVMQNTQGQQSSVQQALQQGQLLGQQALGTPQQIQMANALRQNNTTQQSEMQKQEIQKLGSNTWNPYSDYNRGTNGFGNYGE